ncbi:MAG: hypothetical protein U1E89_19685 [Burkholderiaceae bacterium]
MLQRVTWTPLYSLGHDVLDAQHQRLIALANELADHCRSESDTAAEQRFDHAFAAFKVLVREHLDTEASLLAGADPANAEDLEAEREEFDTFAGEVATTAHFDREELQRFVAVWCIGHLNAAVQARRAAPAGDDAVS